MPEQQDVVVVWTVDAAEAELAAERLWAAGATGLEWRDEDDGQRVTLQAGYPTPAAARTVASELGAQAVEIVDRSWADAWRAYAQPVEVAPGLTVALPGARTINAGELVLEIDPGHCFGSGSHPSTQLLLSLLAEQPPVGLDVLDVGTGSGVLAVAAARLGATKAVGVDVDPEAVHVTEANAARNGVASAVEASTRPLDELDEDFSLILINVTAGIHATLGPLAVRRCIPGGAIWVAGLLPGQWRHVAGAYPGCRVVARRQRDGWEGLSLERLPLPPAERPPGAADPTTCRP